MRRSLQQKGAAFARSRAPPASSRTYASSAASSGYGRTAAYRRIASSSPSPTPFLAQLHSSSPSTITPLLRSSLSPSSILLSRTSASYGRYFSSQSHLRQQAAKPKDEVKDEPAPPPKKEAEKSASGETPGEEQPKSEGEKSSSSEGKEGEEGESKDEKKDGKKGEEAPPPPHGDKTPWQVFTETLRTEFKASKDWQESTKQISAGYQEFTQNENLKAAQSAYKKGSEAVTGTAGAAIKGTAKAIGSGAAWTWDTSVVKGVRKGANLVGSGLEKATRPVRETEAYKSVKETIDDGSSSRYGGWSEKEERRRKREAREAKEFAKTGGKRPEGPVVEDPECVHPHPFSSTNS